ncbi:MAG: beta-ketoacyl-[acyl-carrier-protein] synthase family protein [Planctomycetaceae bacterium]
MSRIVISGVGLVTPLGPDRESSWARLCAGICAPRTLDFLGGGSSPARTLSETAHNRVGTWIGAPACTNPSDESQTGNDPVVSLALQAAAECLTDARSPQDHFRRDRIGCVVGTSKGGLRSFSRLHSHALADDEQVRSFSQIFPHAAGRAVAMKYDLRGPVLSPVVACATGLVCLIRAAELLRDDACDLVIAGSADASLLPIVLGSFRRLGVLARDVGDPAHACRPFDRDRSGFVVGEGGAIFTLEREETALARGAPIWGEWVAGRLASDPHGMMNLEPTGESLAWLIREVLRQGRTSSRELDYLNLHGTATRQNDLCETRAIRAALGTDAYRVACSGQKGSIGHLLGAAGSVEMAIALLSLRDQIVPPTMNLEHPDAECDLDYTPGKAVPRTLQTALKLSLGFGGHLAAGLIRRVD